MQQGKTLLPQLARAFSTSNVTAGSSVAVAKAAPSSGLLGGLFGSSTRCTVPMSEALPGVAVPLKNSVPSGPATLESSDIEGVKVAALASPSPVNTVAVVVSGGSSAETEATAGASKMMEMMAFKSTKNRTTFRLTRELEKIGAVASCTAGRDHISFAVESIKLHTPEATECLLDAVLNARMQFHEVAENLDILKADMAAAMTNPTAVLQDVLHRVAFDGPLGQPLNIDPSQLSSFTHATLHEYYQSVMLPGNMLLASIGGSMDELQSVATPLLSSIPLAGTAATASPSKYIGGSSNVIAAASPLTHVALAFEAKAGPMASVAKALLDSRAAVPWASSGADVSLTSFVHQYGTTALLGVTATAVPSQASAAVDVATRKVAAVASGVTEAQLAQAKAVTVASFKAALSNTSTALPIISASVLATGSFDASAFVAGVAAITPAQITAFVKDMAKGTPTLVTYGGLTHLPRYESIAKRLA